MKRKLTVWTDDYGSTINIMFKNTDVVKIKEGTHVKLNIEEARKLVDKLRAAFMGRT